MEDNVPHTFHDLHSGNNRPYHVFQASSPAESFRAFLGALFVNFNFFCFLSLQPLCSTLGHLPFCQHLVSTH